MILSELVFALKLCAIEVTFPDGNVCLSVATPRDSTATLFACIDATPPHGPRRSHAPAATKQLASTAKPAETKNLQQEACLEETAQW